MLVGFDMNGNASPGMPLMLIAPTNEQLIDELRMTLVALAEARLRLLMETPHEVVRAMSASDLVDAYLVDAVKVFVKQEPHSTEKIVQQRMRLISSRGVVDQMVERFLFGDYQNWCISRWREIPQKPGMGHADEHLKSIWREVQSRVEAGMKPGGTDVRGWDVSVTGEDMDYATDVPIKIMEPPLVIVNAMRNQTLCLARAMWCLSNGNLYVQLWDGFMKSGSFRTAELNSTLRVLKAYMVTLDLGGSPADCWAIAMGDDCCENDFGGFENRKAEYAKRGVVLTDYVPIQLEGEFEFTSHMFRPPGVASLHSWPRTLYRLLMKPYDAAELMQFMYECRYNFELPEILEFLRTSGWIPEYVQVLLRKDQLRPFENSLVVGGPSWGPQKFDRETFVEFRNCSGDFMSKAEKKILKDLKDIKEKEKEKKQATGHKMLPASASSTGKQKAKVISRPSDAVGSVKNYGTPYNALNSQLHKFMPSQTQAALMAWAHTVANPRTKNPHPVPLMAAPGASASVPQMFQCTLYGTAKANAAGCVFIGANGDGWYPATPGHEIPGNEQWPVPDNRWLGVPDFIGSFGHHGQGYPVHYTDENYTGRGGVNPTHYPEQGYAIDDETLGLNFVGLPSDFIPNITNDTRYTNVAVELRVRPVQAQLYASGELIAFNYRRTVTQETSVSGAEGYGFSVDYGTMLALPEYYLSRERLGAPNWPSNKWLTTVAVPNTSTAFGQWYPLGTGLANTNSQKVGTPMVFVMGDGLPEGAPIEFEVTYVYAVYGTRTYSTSGSSGSELYVDASRAAPVVANGFTQLKPRASNGRPDARGVGAVVKAEQADGRMPSVKDVISGVKAGKDIFEAVTGTDIGEEIVSVIGDIAAMLL